MRRRRRAAVEPGIDDALEGVVGGEVEAGQRLHGSGARGAAVLEEPPFDAAAVVGDAGGHRDGVVHDLHGDEAQEQVRRLLRVRFHGAHTPSRPQIAMQLHTGRQAWNVTRLICKQRE
jgi:hypothetical protein